MKPISKIISVLTLLTFLFTNVTYAAERSRQLFRNKKVDHKKLSTQKEESLQKRKAVLKGDDKAQDRKKEAKRILQHHLKDLSQINIPSELGRIIEVYDAERDKGQGIRDKAKGVLVVHIQDLHTNAEAQYNEASILETLIKDYGMSLVLSEGAEGEVDTSSVSNFPDAEVREKTARIFVESGELTAEEYLSITKYPDLPIWGIEDKDVYFKNIIQFNKIVKFSPKSQVFISQAKKALENLRPKLYTSELKEIDQKEVQYENEEIETKEYLDYISSYIEYFNIPTDKYKNISLLIEATEQEKTINQAKIGQDSQNLLMNLQAALSGSSSRRTMDLLMAKAELFKGQKISAFSFYSYLRSLAIKHLEEEMLKYPDMDDFVDYLTKVNSLDTTKLFVEMEDLAYEVKLNLAQTQEQKTLVQGLRNIKFLENLFNLKVSNEELDYYLSNRDSHRVSFFKDFLKPTLKKYGIQTTIDYNSELIDMRLEEIEEFYQTVKKRDFSMVDNSIREIKRRNAKVAALIGGGFHTKGITRLLKEQGYSYVVVSPYSTTEVDEENYQYLLSGKRKPLSELIDEFSDGGTLRIPLKYADTEKPEKETDKKLIVDVKGLPHGEFFTGNMEDKEILRTIQEKELALSQTELADIYKAYFKKGDKAALQAAQGRLKATQLQNTENEWKAYKEGDPDIKPIFNLSNHDRQVIKVPAETGKARNIAELDSETQSLKKRPNGQYEGHLGEFIAKTDNTTAGIRSFYDFFHFENPNLMYNELMYALIVDAEAEFLKEVVHPEIVKQLDKVEKEYGNLNTFYSKLQEEMGDENIKII